MDSTKSPRSTTSSDEMKDLEFVQTNIERRVETNYQPTSSAASAMINHGGDSTARTELRSNVSTSDEQVRRQQIEILRHQYAHRPEIMARIAMMEPEQQTAVIMNELVNFQVNTIEQQDDDEFHDAEASEHLSDALSDAETLIVHHNQASLNSSGVTMDSQPMSPEQQQPMPPSRTSESILPSGEALELK